jgi:phosphate transport system protein
MPRERFDRDLQNLLDQVLILGSMAGEAVGKAMDALRRQDHAAARDIYAADLLINQKRYALEDDAITIIATQQPMARDVRFLAAILEIITELERIGDYAKGISKINLLLGEESIPPDMLLDLQEMAARGTDSLKRALDAFITADPDAARLIADEDDAVDALYLKVYRRVMQLSLEQPGRVEHFNHLMWAAHNLERMSDRVTNICERIIYVATGEMKELDGREGMELGAE